MEIQEIPLTRNRSLTIVIGCSGIHSIGDDGSPSARRQHLMKHLAVKKEKTKVRMESDLYGETNMTPLLN